MKKNALCFLMAYTALFTTVAAGCANNILYEKSYKNLNENKKEELLNSKVISAIHKAYLSGLQIETMPDPSEYKDARILRVYSDIFWIEEKLDNEHNIVMVFREELGYYNRVICKCVEIEFVERLPKWYKENKGYIYWDNKTNKFKVDKNAKDNGVPIDSARRTLCKKQIEQMKLFEKECDTLRIKAYKKILEE